MRGGRREGRGEERRGGEGGRGEKRRRGEERRGGKKGEERRRGRGEEKGGGERRGDRKLTDPIHFPLTLLFRFFEIKCGLSVLSQSARGRSGSTKYVSVGGRNGGRRGAGDPPTCSPWM